MNELTALLIKYGHEADDTGTEAMEDTWITEKRELLDLLRKHPHWNEDRKAIVLSADFERGYNTDEIARFIRYIRLFDEAAKENEDRLKEWDYLPDAVLMSAEKQQTGGSLTVTLNVEKTMKRLYPSIKVTAGMKLSRALGKLAVMTGANKDEVAHTTVRLDGTTETKKRYNKRHAAVMDACGSTKTRRTTVIGVHPMDYLTMSFGISWASCHTIDHENRRNVSGEHHRGMYRTGTISYMCDPSTVIMFTIDDDADEFDFETPKIDRCCMHVEPAGTCFVQGRVYPQEKDADNGIIQNYRSIMQNVLAECIGVPSVWKVEKGTQAACEVIEADPDSTHYNDYAHFSTVTVSRLTSDEDRQPIKIKVGHAAICSCCGEEHTETGSFDCGGCGMTCERCGDRMNEEDYDSIIANDGSRFCCTDCANYAGYEYCDDIGEWSNDYHYDDYEEVYFHYSDYLVIAEDGSTFRNEDNALSAGYDCTTDGEWYREEDIHYCDRCGCYVHTSFWSFDYDCCEACEDEAREEAEREEAEREEAEREEAEREEAEREEAEDILRRAAVYDANIQYYLTNEDRQRGEYVNIFTGEVKRIPSRAA